MMWVWIAYVIGALISARYIALAMIDAEAKTEAQHRRNLSWVKDEPLVGTGFKALCLTTGVFVSSVWPAALLVLAVVRGLTSPTERAEAQRRELEQLRRLAREHDLPMPGEQR